MKLMYLATLVIASALPILGAALQSEPLRYAGEYDDPDTPLSALACSAFLESQGIYTIDQVPNFPNIGGLHVDGPPVCGACYSVTYPGTGNTFYITVVDQVAGEGFVVSKNVMDALTDGRAEELGRIDVWSDQVDEYYCCGL